MSERTIHAEFLVVHCFVGKRILGICILALSTVPKITVLDALGTSPASLDWSTTTVDDLLGP
jgi:hypothetical protein